jgi:hypothetical protein
MPNRGALRGVGNFVDGNDYIGKGGSWAGNRGRMVIDELRLWGYPNSSYASLTGLRAARLINTNPLIGANPFYPNDSGSIVNAIAGSIAFQGVTPFSAVYNTAGIITQCLASSTGNPSCFENDTIITNVAGQSATSLLQLSSVIAGTTYFTSGGTCTLTALNDVVSGPTFEAFSSGTLTCTTLFNYEAHVNVNTGSTVTTRIGYRFTDSNNNSGAGSIGTQVGFDVPGTLSGATVNIGVRNGAPTVYVPSSPQSISTATVISPNATVVQISSTGTVTNTGGISTSNVQNGQWLILVNVGAHSITLSASTTMSLNASTSVMATGTQTQFCYNSTLGAWVQSAGVGGGTT